VVCRLIYCLLSILSEHKRLYADLFAAETVPSTIAVVLTWTCPFKKTELQPPKKQTFYGLQKSKLISNAGNRPEVSPSPICTSTQRHRLSFSPSRTSVSSTTWRPSRVNSTFTMLAISPSGPARYPCKLQIPKKEITPLIL
jgi:hypothetical protein